ncbi:MAG: hypothetical protein JNK85_15805 [Verrucomicrobiales bacterium]|nr:hypothetical protein [Verrucomicrobiales bacterium]
MQLSGRPFFLRTRRALLSGLVLGVFLLLNGAVVLPALHHLWHDHDDCDPIDCVVLTVAQGTMEATDATPPTLEPHACPRPTSVRIAAEPRGTTDCPPLPGRAPPQSS